MREETDYTEAIETYKDEAYVIIEPWGRSIDHLRLTIIGKEGTSYGKGRFIFEVKFPENYPFAPPYAYAVTLMWHPNIDSSIPPGKLNICLDLINPDLVGKVDASTGASGWTPSKTLTNIIEALIYGIIPKANTDKRLRPPPENMSNMPSKVPLA